MLVLERTGPTGFEQVHGLHPQQNDASPQNDQSG